MNNIMTKTQALAIIELHKTVPQPTALLLRAFAVISAITLPS